MNLYDHVINGDKKNEENLYDHCRRSEGVQCDPTVYDHIGNLQPSNNVDTERVTTRGKNYMSQSIGMATQNQVSATQDKESVNNKESMATDNKPISEPQEELFVVDEPSYSDNYNSISIPGEVDDYSFLENTPDGLWKFKD